MDVSLENASIEQIEAMALAAAGGGQPAAETDGTPGDDDGMGGMSDEQSAGEQDVAASSGQTEQKVDGEKPAGKSNDKELNFSKLRTKAEHLESEVAKLKEQNEQLLKSNVYRAELPENHAQLVADVDARIDALGARFQDGELTWAEHQTQLRQAYAEREALTAAALKAQISKEMEDQKRHQEAEAVKMSWEQTVEKFVGTEHDGINYAADEAKSKTLDIYVKALGSNPDNSDKPMEWFLQEAHKLVKAQYGVTSTTTAPAAKQDEKPDTSKAPAFHSLSDIPSGESPAKNEVEQLDQLSGAALTNRFLSDPSQIDKVLASLG